MIGGSLIVAVVSGIQGIAGHGIATFFLAFLTGLAAYLGLALVWEKLFDYQLGFFWEKGMRLLNGT